MENYTFSSAGHKRKNPTTNYPKDEHKHYTAIMLLNKYGVDFIRE